VVDVLTETDDFFCHQIAEPHTIVLLNDLSWSERAYFTVSDPERFGLDIGMSMYPNNNRLEAYAIITTSVEEQVSLRAGRDLGADRWPLRVGPVTTEILDPLKRWHLICVPNESGIEFDLTYTARANPYECRSPVLRKHNRLMYDNTNMFQAGRWDGEIRLDGVSYPVEGIPGHRDRTWGVRASGEGRFHRGLLVWCCAEFEDVSVQALIHERHNGAPRHRMGAVSHVDTGEVVPIVDWEHQLEFDHDSRLCLRASFRFEDENGEVWEIEAEPKLRLFLHGGGYTSGEDRRGFLPVDLWTERWDLTDKSLIPKIDGLNDQISRMRCGDRRGHGIVETLIGEHDRYPVSPQQSLGEHAVV
jgi:hypothetical protein